LYFHAYYFSSVSATSSSAPVTGASGALSDISSILAGLLAETTTVSAVKISNFSESIFKSDILIESHISFNSDKLTSIESTKFLGNTFTSISFKCSSKIPPSFTA
jgi:hypothetical protein